MYSVDHLGAEADSRHKVTIHHICGTREPRGQSELALCCICCKDSISGLSYPCEASLRPLRSCVGIHRSCWTSWRREPRAQ